MKLFKRLFIRALIYNSIVIGCFIGLLNFEGLGGFKTFITFIAFLGFLIAGGVFTASAFRVWRFLSSSRSASIVRLTEHYEIGSLTINEDFNYKVFDSLEELSRLPPNTAVPSAFIYPTELHSPTRVYLESKHIQRGMTSEIPLYVAKWPKSYKAPEEIYREKAQKAFASGMHQKYLLTNGDQGEPLKSLEE